MNAPVTYETLPTKSDIERLQAVMVTLPQVTLTTKHYFADGMYCRELLIPKGATLVGKVHKKEHFCMLTKGDMTIVCDGKRERIEAPKIFVSQPGVKRAGYAHEDSIFVNVHRTFLRDLDEIEAEVVEHDETSLFDARNQLLECK
jgi:hypothetical protein